MFGLYLVVFFQGKQIFGCKGYFYNNNKIMGKREFEIYRQVGILKEIEIEIQNDIQKMFRKGLIEMFRKVNGFYDQ